MIETRGFWAYFNAIGAGALGRHYLFSERLVLAQSAYWLAVRAGVAGRLAEKRDAIAELTHEQRVAAGNDDGAARILARAIKWIKRGDHVGAQRERA